MLGKTITYWNCAQFSYVNLIIASLYIKDDFQSPWRSLSASHSMEYESMLLLGLIYLVIDTFQILFSKAWLRFTAKQVVSSSDMKKNEA